MNPAAALALEVAVFVHVRTKAAGAPVDVDLFDEPGFDEGIQTVVDGGHRDIGQTAFGPHEHLLGGGMIPLPHQDIVDMVPLRGGSQTTGGESLIDPSGAGARCLLHGG